MKPAQISCAEGGLNQIPAWCKIAGDIRLAPFYDIEECRERMAKYVQYFVETGNDQKV